MTSKEIRQEFLDFFEEKRHLIVPSAPIVLKDDPTLMFSNSGMTQFKDYFLGYRTPKNRRIADTQKCLRVSGKHNDLDDVGRDTYHHTMFEMLGSWSFGDYFKKEAIAWAWELLIDRYKVSPEDIYVTIFEGDISENLEKDEEAFGFWKAHVSEDRILLGNKKDNFWEMGESGPCGPCSEIHIDLRSETEKQRILGKDLVNKDHPQVLEIWNLVFMEFNRKSDGTLEKLPTRHVDTGMGFERLCMALQGKESTYDSDIFSPLIERVERISGKRYTAKLEDEKDIAMRVVVDHIRAVTFAIADGQLPSNNGAGYVIRRILRRAVSYAYRFLGTDQPFFYKLVEVLKNQMGSFFPELISQKKLIIEVIKEEEVAFFKTIAHGLVRVEKLISDTLKRGGDILAGKDIFELYDTYGFPDDLTRILAEEKGLTLDISSFEQEQKKAKERSKGAAQSKVYDWVVLKDAPEKFVGYDVLSIKTQITRYRKMESKEGVLYQIVLENTPFYPEGGGQIGDTGYIVPLERGQGRDRVQVLDTKKENGLIISSVKTLPENPGAVFFAEVDENRRLATQKNHSVTHLLHEALRNILGDHVEQKGSYVGPDYLRFDFSHFSKLTDEETERIENDVNEKIKENIPLKESRHVPIKQALDSGVRALFGEKYGDFVRLIEFGLSRELCGGTHVQNTGEIGHFKILSENSVAAGIRRIEAISGNAYNAYVENIEQQFIKASVLLKSKDLTRAIKKLLEENKKLSSEIEILKKEKVKSEVLSWKSDFIDKGNKKLLVKKTSMDVESIKDVVFQLKRGVSGAVIIIFSKKNDKPFISVGVSDDLVSVYQAVNVVNELAAEIRGGGGGNAGFAAAGGKYLEGIEKAYQKALEL
ncbi:MAG: alanine--tRNA ligase [Bergeyella sp.]|nr:alanine--tRNA ligase [Bergeyella sp.]